MVNVQVNFREFVALLGGSVGNAARAILAASRDGGTSECLIMPEGCKVYVTISNDDSAKFWLGGYTYDGSDVLAVCDRLRLLNPYRNIYEQLEGAAIKPGHSGFVA